MRMGTLLIITILLSIFGKGKADDSHSGPVTYLTYKESGMRHQIKYTYEQHEDGTCTLTREKDWNDAKTKTVSVPASIGEELWILVKEQKMWKYKESYSPVGHVLDGTMWHLEIRFKEGKEVYTGGDNAWPSGNGIDQLETYLGDLWDTVCPPLVAKLKYKEWGSMAYPNWYFKLESEDNGKRYWLINASQCHPSQARRVEVPMRYINQIWPIVNEEKMYSYQRDYNSEFQVFDGRSWNLYISFFDSYKTVYSSGYEAWPEGEGINRIEQWCRDTWQALEKKAEPWPLND